MIMAFFLCFYNEFIVESSPFVFLKWHYSVSVISKQTVLLVVMLVVKQMTILVIKF